MKINKRNLLIATAVGTTVLFALSGDVHKPSSETRRETRGGMQNVENVSLEAIVCDEGTPIATTSDMRDFAINAVKKADARNDYEKAKAIYNSLEDLHLEYDADSDVRPLQVQTAAELFNSRRGHCLEVSELYIALTRAVGVRSHHLNLSKQRHGATVFEFGERYFAVDPTEKATLNGKKFKPSKFGSSERQDDFCSEVGDLDKTYISDDGLFMQLLFQDGYIFWSAHKYDEAISKFEKVKEIYPGQKVRDIDKVLEDCRSIKNKYEIYSSALNSKENGRNLYNMGVFYVTYIYDNSMSARFRLKDCEKSIHYLESAKKMGYQSEHYNDLYDKLAKQREVLEQEIVNEEDNLTNP